MWVLLVLDLVHWCIRGCSKQHLRVACGFAGGLVVKALDCEPKGPRFQSHLQDFWVHSALPQKLS